MRSSIWIVVGFLLFFSHTTVGQTPPTAHANLFPLYLEVRVDRSIRVASLKSGDVVEGKLARNVYSSDRKVFSAGSTVRLVVDHIDRQPRTRNDHWPWVVQAFAPRREKVPSFREAIISVPGTGQTVLEVSLISVGTKRPIFARTDQHNHSDDTVAMIRAHSAAPSSYAATDLSSDHLHKIRRTLISLQAREAGNDTFSASIASRSRLGLFAQTMVPAGTNCRVLLLNNVSSSKSHAGDVVQARLLEPVLSGQELTLPVGSLFEGTVLRTLPPRWLSRPGSLTFTFTRVTLPDGSWFPLSAALTEVDLSGGSHTKIDAEGRLHGERPGLKWMLINGGVAGGIAKEVDDGTQLAIEAILSGATDASTAGTARIAGMIVSGVFMLSRHGRDVILPNFSTMDVTLTRPLTLAVQTMSSSEPANR